MGLLNKLVSAIALLALAVAGNYFAVSLFNGVEFIFGSIAALVALRLLGIGWGCAIAFLAGIVTYLNWGHPWAMVIFTAEIAIVGLLMRRTDNMVLAVALFWLIIGLLMVKVFYNDVMGLPSGTAWYIGLKQGVNGILNAVVAALLLEVGRRYVPSLRRHLPNIWFSTLIFYVITAVVVVSSTMFITSETRAEYRRSVESMSHAMTMIGGWTKRELEAGTAPEFLTDRFDATLRPVLADLDQLYYPLPMIAVGLIHDDGSTTTFRGVLRSAAGNGTIFLGDSGVEQWEPNTEMSGLNRALKGVYLINFPLPDFPEYREIRVEISAQPMIKSLEAAGRQNLTRLALIILVVMIVCRFLTLWLTQPTQTLARASDGILANIMKGRSVPELPSSGIHEFEALTAHMRGMSAQLTQAFSAQRDLNHTLEKRVQARTADLELMSQVAKQTTNTVIVTDAEGLITWTNDAATDLTGYPLAELRGKRPGDILQKVPPRHDVLEKMRKGIKRKRGFHVEMINHKKDGTPYWVEVRCNPTFDSQGNHTGFIAIENEVTARRETSRALVDTLARLDLATEMAKIGVWSYELKSDELEWNEENHRLHGISETTNDIYSTWAARVQPKDLLDMQELLRNAQVEHAEEVSFEYRFDHPELGERIISSSVRITSRDENGLRRYTGVNLDITESREASRKLQSAAAKTAAILDNAHDSIITIDPSGTIISYNRAAEEMFGYGVNEAIGRNVSLLMAANHAADHDNHIEAYMNGRDARMIGQVTEMEAKRANGEIFPIELAVSRTQDESGVVFIGIIRDLTERRRVEQMKSEFLAMVSHELRTPLTSIHGTLSLIKGGVFGKLDQKADKMLTSSLGNAEMLGTMIDEILDLEKLTSGKMEVFIEKAGLVALMDRAMGSTKPYADRFSVDLELNQPVPDVHINIDETRTIQVLTNLISNAVKFSPEGSKVTVDAKQSDGWVRISVIDRGIGIAEEKQDMLFQKFSQIDASDSRKNRGTGLGLAISRELTESMGGRIGVTSAAGEGSTFWVEFRTSDTPANASHDTTPELMKVAHE
ncbi:PAS domain S-box protein [Roseovarius sp. 2305UL8-3]|uniref:PAS domain S-box protein n=1 Tax=Roseovarius conchicola TaxID=3121636 RepID=UPI003527C10A